MITSPLRPFAPSPFRPMTDFAAIDFELTNHHLSSVCSVGVVCGYDLQNHHHALADAKACAVITMKIL